MTRWKGVVLAAILTLCACSGHRYAFQPLQADSAVETVGDEAAVVAHRATDSDLTAIAVNATNAFGAPLRTLSDGQSMWASQASPSPDGICRDGAESFAPDRNGDPDSQEFVQFYDGHCTDVARETVAVVRGSSATSETIDRTTWIYDAHSTVPSAERESVTIVEHASIAPSGRPIARDGYVATTSTRLSMGNRVRSVTGSQEVAVPGGIERCQAAAGYDAAGVPTLDATFGWQSASIDRAVQRADASGSIRTVVSNDIGGLFVGAVGSLSISSGTLQASCPIVRPAYSLTGGSMSGTFKMTAQAAFDRGLLRSLRVPGGSMSGGYRFDAWTDGRSRDDGIARRVRATLSNDRSPVAAIDADRFGDGIMTVTATGQQYRLVDWTVVQ